MDIFLLCLRQQIQLDVSWVPRDCNSYADFVSKMVDLDDYSVHNDIFLLLEDRLAAAVWLLAKNRSV